MMIHFMLGTPAKKFLTMRLVSAVFPDQMIVYVTAAVLVYQSLCICMRLVFMGLYQNEIFLPLSARITGSLIV